MSVDACRKLADEIEALEDTLQRNAAEGRISSIQTGSEQTGYFTPSEDQILRQLRRKQERYNRMSCAVILGKPETAAASRGPIRPRF